MAAPSVTNTFSNGTTADATEVNQNFTDIINGITDGTKDLTISAFTVGGAATFNGAVTLGNATGDDITFSGYVDSSIIPKTNAASDLGTSALSWQSIFLDNDATDGGAIYFDAGSTEFIKANAAGTDLLIDGFTTVTIDATLVPQTTQATDLGSTSLAWSSLYLDTGATDGGAIYFNSGTTAFLKATADGADLALGGFTGLDLVSAKIKTLKLENVAKTADYPVTDTDGVVTIYMTTSTTDRVVTLPTAADNAGRSVKLVKVDSASGKASFDGELSETVNGATGATADLVGQYESATVYCDGTEWFITEFVTHQRICRAYRSSAASLQASDSWVHLGLDAESYDPLGWYTSSATAEAAYFQPNTPGYYEITVQVSGSNIQDVEEILVAISSSTDGGSTIGDGDIAIIRAHASSTADLGASISDIVYLDGSNDRIYLTLLFNTAANRGVIATTAGTFMTCKWLYAKAT